MQPKSEEKEKTTAEKKEESQPKKSSAQQLRETKVSRSLDVESSLALRFSLCRSSSRRGGNEWESDFDPREPSFSSQRLLLFILHTLYCQQHALLGCFCRRTLLKFSKSPRADKVRSLIVHPAAESIVVSCGHNHLQQSAFDRIRRRLSRILVLHPYFDGEAAWLCGSAHPSIYFNRI